MNAERLLRRIRLGEDSTLELKQVVVREDGRIEPHGIEIDRFPRATARMGSDDIKVQPEYFGSRMSIAINL